MVKWSFENVVNSYLFLGICHSLKKYKASWIRRTHFNMYSSNQFTALPWIIIRQSQTTSFACYLTSSVCQTSIVRIIIGNRLLHVLFILFTGCYSQINFFIFWQVIQPQVMMMLQSKIIVYRSNFWLYK